MALINKIKNKLKREDKEVREIAGDKKTAKIQTDDQKDNRKQRGEYADILIKPLVTEKSTELGVDSKYVFIVSKRANKKRIAKAIQTFYQIKPTKINIIKTKGKKKRLGRIWGRRKDVKKAIITLPKGKKLDVYEGV